MTDKDKTPQANPVEPPEMKQQESAPEPSEAQPTKKVEFEVPEGATRGVFVYEVADYPVPVTDGFGDINVGQIYRLFQEATANINARMIADAVVDRLLGSMTPPPEMMEGAGGLDIPESPHTEPGDDTIPETEVN